MFLTGNRAFVAALFFLAAGCTSIASSQQFQQQQPQQQLYLQQQQQQQQQLHPQPQQQQPQQQEAPVNGPSPILPAELRSSDFLVKSHRSAGVFGEKPNILQKLNIFSLVKRKNKEQDPMMASDSVAMTRFAPFSFSPPPPSVSFASSAPRTPFSPFMAAAPSNRAMSYYNPFLYGSLGSFGSLGSLGSLGDPYGSIARRMAMPSHSRSSYPPMSASQMPTYFPLGSMMGTPIMDPNLGAALASTLTNRYSQNPLGPMVGSSIYGASLYEDPYDSGLLASALKRYFKAGGRGRGKPRDEMRMPSDYSYDKFEYGYSSPRYNEGSARDTRRPAASNRYRDSDYSPKYTSNSYDYSGHSRGNSDDSPPPARDAPAQSDSNSDDYRSYEGRPTASSDSIAPPPQPSPSTAGRMRERVKDSNEGPYVDMYGWRGPSKSVPIESNQRNSMSDMDEVRREESSMRQPVDRYGHELPPYGSKTSTLPSPPPSTYKDSVNRSDLDAVASDTHEKGRSIY